MILYSICFIAGLFVGSLGSYLGHPSNIKEWAGKIYKERSARLQCEAQLKELKKPF